MTAFINGDGFAVTPIKFPQITNSQHPDGWSFDQAIIDLGADNTSINQTVLDFLQHPNFAVATKQMLRPWGPETSKKYKHVDVTVMVTNDNDDEVPISCPVDVYVLPDANEPIVLGLDFLHAKGLWLNINWLTGKVGLRTGPPKGRGAVTPGTAHF